MMTIPYCSSVNLFYAPAVLGKKENELDALKVIYGPDDGWDEEGP